MQWISVKDRLPEAHIQKEKWKTSGFVFVYLDDGNIDIDEYIVDESEFPYQGWAETENVTHWMTLPEPPKTIN